MKILVIADEESKLLYDYFDPECLKGIDLIISCGDLDPDYLSFLATLSHAPVLYVRGNHDTQYEKRPPEGCICIEDDIFVFHGIRILGLGGSMQYIPGSPNQFTERQMSWRIKKLTFKLVYRGGFDILVTHAPAFQFHDMEDLPHQGFKAFLRLIRHYRPKFFFHGHIHATYGAAFKRRDMLGETTVINAYGFYIVDYT